MRCEVVERLAEIGDAGLGVSTSDLRDQGFVPVLGEERAELSPSVRAICDTVSGCTGTVAVEVLVNIEDEERFITCRWVFDVQERVVVAVQPVIGVSPEVSGESDDLRLGTSGTDRIDGSLNRCGPLGVVWDIMWLVHQAEDDLGLVLVLGSEKCPHRCEVGIGRTALSDDPSVPPCIVVQVNHNVRPGGQGCLDEVVELSEETRGEGGRCLVVSNQSLPVDGKSDKIGAFANKVSDLISTGTVGSSTASVGVGTKLASSKVDTAQSGNSSLGEASPGEGNGLSNGSDEAHEEGDKRKELVDLHCCCD